MADEKLKEGLVECICGNWYPEDDCVTLHDGKVCHTDEAKLCESDGCWYHEDDDDVVWCETHEVYYFQDDCIWAELYSGGEGWVYNETAYAYSEWGDRYFQDDDTAERNGYIYSESREDWIHEDDFGNEGECWDNSTVQKTSKTFRKTFGMRYTFGVEMETCDGYLDYESILNLRCVEDGSINAKEYVTGVLNGDDGMIMLKRSCEAISERCYVDKSCGVHVHIGGANFNRRFSILSIMLGQMMESQLFRIQPKSRRGNSYCLLIPKKYKELRTVSKRDFPYTHKRMLRLLAEYVYGSNVDFDKHNCKKSRNPNGHYSSTRYKWLNLNNCSYKDKGDTVEFRQHSGSLDYHKIRRWVLFCMSFVNFVENHSRTIIETYNRFQEDQAICISMREVLVASLGKEGDVIADYYDNREERFN